jgi:uncharacterized membrane protein SpoIIM required for sporulation
LREALFIKKNKDRWERVQDIPSEEADEMARDFTQLVDDLAYAKTFYPTSKVTHFINAHAAKIFLGIYKNRKEESNRLVTFWKYDLPLLIRKHYRTLLFAFAFFLVFFSIGFFTQYKDPDVARAFFGDGYVDMTEKNIKSGNPFGVYEDDNPLRMWLKIMINNIKVAGLMVFWGLTCGIGSLYLLAHNSAMVGVFDQMFAAKGLGWEFWLVVFVHGTLEITAIILAGGAGLVLGKSFLFPGTIRRIDAFKQGAKDSVKIMIGLVPVLAVAAFFEGFITRLYNDAPALTSVVFFLSVLFVIWYFIIYPIRLGKKMKPETEEEV